MARSVKATDEIALVAMSQKVSERYLNLKGRKKKEGQNIRCHCNLHIYIRDIITSVRRFY